MKKLPALLLCAALVLTLMPVTARAAISVDTTDYAFDAATGMLTIKSNAAIEWVGAYGDRHWWRDSNFSPNDVKAVNILNGVTEIDDNTFRNTSLTSVTIPNSVTSIGFAAFADCTSLKSMTIPNSVTSIGEQAFARCTALTSVTIPNSITSIGILAFLCCTALTSVTIPNSVISIGLGVFSNCTALTSVTIPSSVTSIGDNAFIDCAALTSVTIPNSVISIGYGAFVNCTALTSMAIPSSVTSIDQYAFYNCNKLTIVLTSAVAPAFGLDWADNVSKVYYPTAWGAGAVSNYEGRLIPDPIETADYSFSAGTLTIKSNAAIEWIGAYGDGHWRKDTNFSLDDIEAVDILNGVTEIGDFSFSECTALTSVSISNSVTSIGNRAFYNSDRLTIVLTSAVPPTFGSDWAYSVDGVCYPAAWGAPGSGVNLNYSGNAYATIDEANIYGVTAPVRAAVPVSTITETAQYTGTVTWSPVNNRFSGGKVYTATIALTPNPGYTLTSVAENLFTVAGAVATNAANSGVITAVFPATSKAPDSDVQRTLTSGVTGISVSGLIHGSAELIEQDMALHQEGTCDACNAIRKAQSKGQLILGFDIDLTRDFSGPLTISIPVGNQHNGRMVTILHCVNSRLEMLTATVADGKAAFTVTDLSPFAVTTGLPDNMVSDPPNTGDAANLTGFVMLGLAALCSGYLVMKRRKA